MDISMLYNWKRETSDYYFYFSKELTEDDGDYYIFRGETKKRYKQGRRYQIFTLTEELVSIIFNNEQRFTEFLSTIMKS